MFGEPVGFVRSAEKMADLLLHIGKAWAEGALNLVYRLFGQRRVW